ncbi:MAG: Maf family nucleotide pyrophosphatase, partial [Alphaproteobacteria bacterium]
MPHQISSHQDRLVLASASPRRLDLLSQINIIPDQVLPAALDETPLPQERPADYARRMAREKAEHIRLAMTADAASSYILAGDTVVAVGRRILPKAEDVVVARQCLELLSGRSHRVYGGIALLRPDGGLRLRLVQSQVRFRRLSAADIEQYIAGKDWQGKAGGYAIQGQAAAFIRHMSG